MSGAPPASAIRWIRYCASVRTGSMSDRAYALSAANPSDLTSGVKKGFDSEERQFQREAGPVTATKATNRTYT